MTNLLLSNKFRQRIVKQININNGSKQKKVLKLVEMLPCINVKRQNKRNTKVQLQAKNSEIILMQSRVFPNIYYKATTMRNVLKQFKFPEKVKALPPDDERSQLIVQIASKAINQISFTLNNILVGQDEQTLTYYLFFSGKLQIIKIHKPFLSPNAAIVQSIFNCFPTVQQTFFNQIKATFHIPFQDSSKLWANITYFKKAKLKDRRLKTNIAQLISNGRYRKIRLSTVVEKTSKQIISFYKNQSAKKQQTQESQYNQNTFLTQNQFNPQQFQRKNRYNTLINEQEDILSEQNILRSQQKDNIQIMKMKIKCLDSKFGENASKEIAKNLVNEGKIFSKHFDFIRKIDECMNKEKGQQRNLIKRKEKKQIQIKQSS